MGLAGVFPGGMPVSGSPGGWTVIICQIARTSEGRDTESDAGRGQDPAVTPAHDSIFPCVSAPTAGAGGEAIREVSSVKNGKSTVICVGVSLPSYHGSAC